MQHTGVFVVGLLLLIFGSVMAAGFVMPDMMRAPDELDGEDDPNAPEDEGAVDENQATLEVATFLDAEEVPSTQAPALEANRGTAEQDTGSQIYGGIPDSDLGSTDRSFGIAHRFTDGSSSADTLEGGAGEDTIYTLLGDDVLGSSGADETHLLVPATLVGSETSELSDFDAFEDTLILTLERAAYTDDAGHFTRPEISITQDETSTYVNIDGAQIVSTPSSLTPISLAISQDGNGEEFVDLDGVPLDDAEVQQRTFRFVFLNDQFLYGL